MSLLACSTSSLRRVLCCSYGNHAHVILLKTYLDDSGKSDDPAEDITCIAGAISPLAAWQELEIEWKEILRKFDVPYLHMKEFAHSVPGSPFEKWKSNKEVRKEFLSSLMDSMARHVLSVIGTTVPNEHFRRLIPAQQQMLKDPYFMCFQGTIHAAGVNAFAEHKTVGRGLEVPSSDLPEEEKLEIIFSRQDEFRTFADGFHELMRRQSTIGVMLGSLSWASYRDVIPLQVADLVAYEMKSFASTLVNPKRTTIRMPMKRLFSMNPLFTFLDYNEMVKRFYFSGRPFATS